MNVLGIDFGTSSTVAVLSAFERGPRAIEIDGSVTMSSAVFALEDGTLVVGQDAERRARLDPARFEPNPKRRIDEGTLLLGTNVVPVTDALAAVLRRVGEEAVRQLNGQLPGEVRLSHPAGWGAPRQETLRQAALKAGFGSVTLLPEPVAAAAHYAAVRSQPLAPGNALAVYDLGAGTFDCAVVGVTRDGFNVLAHNGLADLGSLDIDQALLVYVGRQVSHLDPAQWQRLLRPQSVADRRMRRVLMQDVRDAKESLSRHPHTEVPMPEPFKDVLVTRTELEALVRPNLLRSAELLAETIREAGLTPQQLTGIYLVGGPSRMPLVASLLADKLGVVPTTLDQPETAVAFGLHQDSVAPAGASSPAAPPPPSEARTVPAMPPVPQRGVWQPSPPPVSPAPVLARRKSRKVPILAGAGVLLLVVVLVTVLVLVTRNSDETPVAGGTTAQQIGGGAEVNCDESAKVDTNGLTDCIRQLAGSVVDRGACQPGIGGVGMPSIGGATIVTCTMPAVGYGPSTEAVVYYQGLPYATLKVGAQSQMGDSDQLVEGRWQGGGLSGPYLAGMGPVGGILLFGEDDKDVAGMLVSIDENETVEDVVDYFEHYVKPGT